MSYRNRRPGAPDVLPNIAYRELPQIPKSSSTSKRLSMTSNGSSEKQSISSLEGPASKRPSGIPRPKKSTSSTRPDTSMSIRPTGTVSTQRKSSTKIPAAPNQTRSSSRLVDRTSFSNHTPRIVTDEDLLTLEPTIPPLEIDPDAVYGIAIPQYKQPPKPAVLPPRLIPELQALAAATQRGPTPAMSTISTISSPSTQFTTSPSPWSASTTTTTPTSWSSASPSVIQYSRAPTGTKRSYTVPIPSNSRTKVPNLPVLREIAASSAASSKTNIQSEEPSKTKRSKKKTPLSSPAPTPPPRTSSVKRNRSRSDSKNDVSASPTSKTGPPILHDEDVSPTLKHVEEVANRHNQFKQTKALNVNHNKLQNALNSQTMAQHHESIDSLSSRHAQALEATLRVDGDPTRKLMDAAPIEYAVQPVPKSLELTRTKTTETEPGQPASRSRSRLAKFSKLALFGKSSKAHSEDQDGARQPRKLQRRGPSAGTGHEGYSRFGRREQRTSRDGYTTGTDSETSVVSMARKPMQSVSRNDSSTNVRRNRSSQSDLDDFVATRLKPVVIVGGTKKLDEIRNVELVSGSEREVYEDNLGDRSELQERNRQPSVTSSGPLMRESRLMFHLDSLDSQRQSRLAERRSQKLDKTDRIPILEPINMAVLSGLPYPSTHNTSQSSVATTSAAWTETSLDLYKDGPQLPEKQKKKSRKLNWGFFRRKEVAPAIHESHLVSGNAAPKMTVAISAASTSTRPVPYYAVLESENDVSRTEAIGDFLTEAARAMPDEDESVLSMEAIEQVSPERTRSILLPSAPQLKTEYKNVRQNSRSGEQVHFQRQTHDELVPPSKLRQPRLAQVGRIPKVVPTTQASPVVQTSPSQGSNSGVAASPQKPACIVKKSLQPTLLSINTGRQYPIPSKPSATPVQIAIERTTSKGPSCAGDAYTVPDRYSTTSSSTDGVHSVLGPPLLPAPEYPLRTFRYTTTEDDVWNEYDELIDQVISPPRLKKSRTRICDDDKVQPTTEQNLKVQDEKLRSIHRPPRGLTVNTGLAPPPRLFTSSGSLSDKEIELDFRLRRSRIVSALHSSLDPSSPFSIGDYLVESGDAKRNSGRNSGCLSGPAVSQGGLRSPRLLFASQPPPTSQAEYRHHENAVHMDESERSKNPARHSELSYASLMVSRWLSFGRVLFSPAHSDIQKLTERHVLVIDGLENEDWSIYCAVSYQAEQAYIYDLKETGYNRSSASPTKKSHTPPNLRRREMSSFNQAFNFPDNFFSVIVLRFPPVMAESKLRNIIAECRRVLAPGGYMELMLLDLDIVNMGVLTRRAMRELKTEIAMRNREVSLKPVIDNVQSVLGEKGFSKLSRCVVGVPVVGKPPDAESPDSSRSSGNSDKFRKQRTAGPLPLDGLEGRFHNNFSLNDLVADHSDNADAKIGRVVSKTARSWWQHCFEAAVISDGNLEKSIFADRQVLNECKARASSFKLLIAYTQKPNTSAFASRRRTMSEPVVATLATAKSP